MNAPLLPEVLLQLDSASQAQLPLATEGVLRYVWGSRWGEMLIEVIDGVAYVNCQRVEPADSARLDAAKGPNKCAP